MLFALCLLCSPRQDDDLGLSKLPPAYTTLTREHAKLKRELDALKDNVAAGIVDSVVLEGRMLYINLQELPRRQLRYYWIGETTFFGSATREGVDPAVFVEVMNKHRPKVELHYGNRETGEPVWLWVERPKTYQPTCKNLEEQTLGRSP